jgi:THO complex subunit 2
MDTEPALSNAATREATPVVATSTVPDDVEMTTEPTPEELLRQKKSELLLSIKQKHSFQWTQLTDEFVENPDDLDKLILRIDNDINMADTIFYEIIYSAKFQSDRLPITKLGDILDKLVGVKESSTLFFKFMKIFNTFQLDDNLRKLIQSFRKLPNVDIAKHSNNPSFIQERNIILDYKRVASNQSLKIVSQKTYNLLIESNEGYAKLIVTLNQVFMADDAFFQVDYTAKVIDRLTGHFNLDPTRVLDIILDILIHSIPKNYRFALDLLKKTPFWPIVESDNSSIETLNIGGNELAARLIASKMKYHLETDRDMSESLKTSVAVFIKEGFISFGSIIKYIGPDEATMDELNEFVEKAIDDEIFKSSANALALSGPLADDEDDADSGKTNKENSKGSKADKEEKKEKRLKELNHKFQITKQLLANGVYWPAIYMLNKYPYLANSDETYTDLILRLFNVAIQPLKSKISVLNEEQLKLLKNPQRTAFVRRSSMTDAVEFEEYKYTTIETFKPLTKSHTTKKFVYFYREWAAGVPQAENYDDLFTVSNQLLPFLGAKLGKDLSILAHLCDFGCDDLRKYETKEELNAKLEKWFNYFKKFIFPASTATVDNPIISSNIYKLLSKFPLQWRYNLYGDLYQNISKSDLSVKLNYLRAEKQTKDVLKRITKDNMRPMMRRLAKITFSNPLPSFLIMLQQVENYDNLTDLIIKAARYFTDYAWDVLPFVLLIRLTSSNRVHTQSDGLNDSPWLQSLSSFIAKLSKRYSKFNLQPILTFIVKDLSKNNTIGLTILRDLVGEMGGIQQLTNLSLNQVKLLNSSDLLQKMVRKVIFDTRDESVGSAKRLIHALVENNQLSELFLILVDFAKKLVDDDHEDNDNDGSYLKVLSQKIDVASNVLHTYVELINYFLKDESDVFVKSVIGIKELISQYKVDTNWGFELWRRYLKEDVDGKDLDFTNVDFTSLSKKLYFDFWRFSLYDIEFDETLYSIEKEKLISSNKSVTENIKATEEKIERFKNAGRNTREFVDQKGTLVATEKSNSDAIEKITASTIEHKRHSESILSEIKKSSSDWFEDPEAVTPEEIEALIQFAIIPRALQSSSDAIFTNRFISNLFDPALSQSILSTLFTSNILNGLIFTLTPLESEHLGVFFADIFNYYEEVRSDETTSNEQKILIFNWHTTFLESIRTSIKSDNYMTRRNSITLLKNLIGIYPIVEDHNEVLAETIAKVSQTESRNDLKLASDAILALINSKSKKWIHLWDFYEFEEEERTRLENERFEVLKEREDEKLRLRHEAQKKEQAEKLKYYKRPTTAEPKIDKYEEEREKVGSNTAEEKKTEDTKLGDVEDIKVDSKANDVNVDEDELLVEDDEEENIADIKEEPKLEKTEDKSDEKKRVDEKKRADSDDVPVSKKFTINKESTPKSPSTENDKSKTEGKLAAKGPSRAVTAEATEKRLTPPVNIPTGPSGTPGNRSRFQDVTASITTEKPAAKSSARVSHYDTLRSIADAVKAKDHETVYSLIDDTFTVKNLKAAERDVGKSHEILIEYARKLTRGRSGQAFKTFSDNIKRNFSASLTTESKTESTSTVRARKPLEPQEAISGYGGKPTTKWGTNNNNRTMSSNSPAGPNSNRHYNQGFRHQGGGSQYNQGYRNSNSRQSQQSPSQGSAGSVPPPPPPPPPSQSSQSSSRVSSQKRPFDRQRSDAEKRPRRN